MIQFIKKNLFTIQCYGIQIMWRISNRLKSNSNHKWFGFGAYTNMTRTCIQRQIMKWTLENVTFTHTCHKCWPKITRNAKAFTSLKLIVYICAKRCANLISIFSSLTHIHKHSIHTLYCVIQFTEFKLSIYYSTFEMALQSKSRFKHVTAKSITF